ncbi:MAG: helix-turn-helix transcriptional regulator [Alphaproteobacteria bacterium]|nr:helix-turn-helix transcriptional regulator [Alphaproteobacteria bacterium]MCB9792416.1 helix-turn-helix transcriptional regulator [Alphaproteobacteria bacterium]
MDSLLLLLTPADVEQMLAQRLRTARKQRGWTQAELASRSGLSTATVARLEQTGQGQISSLLHLAAALDQLDAFEGLFELAAPSSLAELRRQASKDDAP